MANTVIQLKYSDLTNTPTSLATGEAAYSNTSDTLFLGLSDGSVVNVGGVLYTSQIDSATSSNTASTIVKRDANGKITGDIIGNADTATTAAAWTTARDLGLAGDATGNVSIDGSENETLTVTLANSGVTAKTYGDTANIPQITVDAKGRVTGVSNVAISIPSSYTDANVVSLLSSFGSNTITTTGAVATGDMTITGNLTVTGETTYANTTTVNLGDNIITLNADIPQGSAPGVDAGIEVDRGSSANVALLWNETSDKWTFTNNGSDYFAMADADRLDSAYGAANTAQTTADAAFGQANTATTNASAAQSTANGAYAHANGAFAAANSAATSDYTNVSITAGDYGSNVIIPVVHLEANGRVSAVANTAVRAGSTSVTGIVQLTDATNSTSTTTAATPNAVKSAYDLASTANTNAATAQTTADAAYGQANTATTDAAAAQTTADAAFGQANTATTNASTAQSTADGAYAHANGAFGVANTALQTSGGTISGNLAVTGNLIVSGNTVTTDVETIVVQDSLVKYANNNTADALDIGFYGTYNDGTQKYTTLYRDASDSGKYKLLTGGTTEPSAANTVDPSTFSTATLVANIEGNVTGGTVSGLSSDIAVADGGTGAGSFTLGAILIGNGTSALQTLANSSYTLTGTLGASKTITALTVDAYGRTTAATAADIAIAASQVTSGTFSVSQGGTGASTLTSNGVLLGQGTSAITAVSSATEGHVLQVNSSGVPTFAHLNGGSF